MSTTPEQVRSSIPTPQLILVLNADSSVDLVDEGALGAVLDADWTSGRTALDLVSALDRDAVRDAVRSVRTIESATATVQARIRDGDGCWRQCSLTLVGLGSPDDRRVLVRVRDVTDEQRRAITKSLETQILEHLPTAVCAVDEDALVVYWNRTAESLFGALEREVIGRRIDTLTDRLLPDDDLAGLLTHLDQHGVWEGDYEVRRPDGSTRPVVLSIRRTDETVHGFTGLIAVATDAQPRIDAASHDALRSLQDLLTGLPNRTLFVDHVDQALRRRNHRLGSVAVMRIDIDGFHHINDDHGIEIGDAVLVALADRLAGGLAPLGAVARVGGDAFAALAEGVRDPEHLDRILTQVLELVSSPLSVRAPSGSTVELSVGASIGAAFARNGEGPEALLRTAQVALVDAKALGGARARVFDDAHYRTLTHTASVASRLRRGLDEGEAEVWFQPIVDATDATVVGFEALSRWRRDGEIVPPDEYISVAETHGLIGDIGRLARRQAVDAIATWATPPGFVAVNVSPVELTPCLVDEVRAIARELPGEDHRLVLEITESTLVDVAALAVLEQLRGLGVRVALDDFGTGHSSLARLATAPTDELKIDRTFVSGLVHDPGCRAVTAALLQMAEQLDLVVIAEGVETHEQRTMLLDMGCRFAQGYLWSPALTRREAETLLDAQAKGSANGSSLAEAPSASGSAGR